MSNDLKVGARCFVYSDSICQPAFIRDVSSMGVLVDYFVSGRYEMVESERVGVELTNASWERACEYGHLSLA